MASTLAGVVLMTRHGDREGFYQDPLTYSATGTTITPLGSLQHFNSGQALQKRYASNDSTPTDIAGLSWPAVSLKEVVAMADASEGQVIVDSALAFMQGFYPPNKDAFMTLANGSIVQAPFNGFVYVPVETVEADESIIFEAYTECPAFTRRTKAVYQTPEFLALSKESQPFRDSLSSIVGGRNTSLEAMYNLFDYMNVNYIHNASFYKSVDIETMRYARALANDHEYRVFSDPDIGSIGNLAGRALLPTVIDGLERIANETDGLKLLYLGASYKPFMSCFSMLGTKNENIVDYASVAAFELWKDPAGEFSVELRFRNGSTSTTDGSDLAPMQMFGQNSVSLASFKKGLEPYLVTNLGQWCNLCENTETRGCDLIQLVNATTEDASVTSTVGRHRTSPLVSGVIGALVGILLAAVAFAALEVVRSRRSRSRRSSNSRHGPTDGDSTYELRGAPSIDSKSQEGA